MSCLNNSGHFFKCFPDTLYFASVRVTDRLIAFFLNGRHNACSYCLHHSNSMAPCLSPVLESHFFALSIVALFAAQTLPSRSYAETTESRTQSNTKSHSVLYVSLCYWCPLELGLCALSSFVWLHKFHDTGDLFLRWKQPCLLFYICLMLHNLSQCLLSAWDGGLVLDVRRDLQERVTLCKKNSVFSQHYQFF